MGCSIITITITLTLYRRNINISNFCIFFSNSDDKGSWSPSSWKARTGLSYTVNIMVADGLVMQCTRVMLTLTTWDSWIGCWSVLLLLMPRGQSISLVASIILAYYSLYPTSHHKWLLLIRRHSGTKINFGRKCVSFCPNDIIWLHKSGSTLPQVMAWCLMARSHYLNQHWLIICKGQWHSAEGIIIRRSEITDQ